MIRMQAVMRLSSSNDSKMPALANALADRIAAALPDEARCADQAVLRSALLTLAHRLQPAPLVRLGTARLKAALVKVI